MKEIARCFRYIRKTKNWKLHFEYFTTLGNAVSLQNGTSYEQRMSVDVKN